MLGAFFYFVCFEDFFFFAKKIKSLSLWHHIQVLSGTFQMLLFLLLCVYYYHTLAEGLTKLKVANLEVHLINVSGKRQP